ncbi:hypothetical protein [Chamaesiphon minutus]|uniref:Uncharacterized protein n=1 Tax=Chamaesiphon minutus (strain ATCC 27169 / PCC 6605) TaxID=1173020 RepID=K9UDC4_CHAP6|nr:hypothetical protein [Chamaesiphon minutus]AFY92810.1 hypothetical protein Cha6605_1672 [Chamaesiphon minutus PCC 6605]
MSKQIKTAIGAMLAVATVLVAITGSAFAAEEAGGCACCKKMGSMSMPMPMPMPNKK